MQKLTNRQMLKYNSIPQGKHTRPMLGYTTKELKPFVDRGLLKLKYSERFGWIYEKRGAIGRFFWALWAFIKELRATDD